MLLFFGITQMMAGQIEEALNNYAEARRLAEASEETTLVLETLGPPIHAYISSGQLHLVSFGISQLRLHIGDSKSIYQYERFVVCFVYYHFYDESHFRTDLSDEI